MSYIEFEAKWLAAGRVDTDSFPKGHIYQCVDLPKQYLKEEKGLVPGSFGDAKYWWLSTNSEVLKVCDRIETTDVKAGDIVPLRPVDNLASHSGGHIGIATGRTTATTVEILEQNGSTGQGQGTGPDAIRKRFVPKSRVYGVLRLKAAVPAPTPGHPLSHTVGKEVFLPPTDSAWRVYAPGSVAPRDAIALLNPKKYGGLWYRVDSTERALNSVLVTTQMFGKVSLPIASDAKGTLYPGIKIR